MAETTFFGNAMASLRTLGFFDIVMPFLLVFAILYGVLERSKIFGEDRHDLNAVIAMAIALIVVGTSWVVGLITGFLPWVGLLAVLFLGILLLLMMFIEDFSKIQESGAMKWIVAIIIPILMLIALKAAGFNLIAWVSDNLIGEGGENYISDIFALLIFVGLMFMIVKKPGEKSKTG